MFRFTARLWCRSSPPLPTAQWAARLRAANVAPHDMVPVLMHRFVGAEDRCLKEVVRRVGDEPPAAWVPDGPCAGRVQEEPSTSSYANAALTKRAARVVQFYEWNHAKTLDLLLGLYGGESPTTVALLQSDLHRAFPHLQLAAAEDEGKVMPQPAALATLSSSPQPEEPIGVEVARQSQAKLTVHAQRLMAFAVYNGLTTPENAERFVASQKIHPAAALKKLIATKGHVEPPKSWRMGDPPRSTNAPTTSTPTVASSAAESSKEQATATRASVEGDKLFGKMQHLAVYNGLCSMEDSAAFVQQRIAKSDPKTIFAAYPALLHEVKGNRPPPSWTPQSKGSVKTAEQSGPTTPTRPSSPPKKQVTNPVDSGRQASSTSPPLATAAEKPSAPAAEDASAPPTTFSSKNAEMQADKLFGKMQHLAVYNGLCRMEDSAAFVQQRIAKSDPKTIFAAYPDLLHEVKGNRPPSGWSPTPSELALACDSNNDRLRTRLVNLLIFNGACQPSDVDKHVQSRLDALPQGQRGLGAAYQQALKEFNHNLPPGGWSARTDKNNNTLAADQTEPTSGDAVSSSAQQVTKFNDHPESLAEVGRRLTPVLPEVAKHSNHVAKAAAQASTAQHLRTLLSQKPVEPTVAEANALALRVAACSPATVAAMVDAIQAALKRIDAAAEKAEATLVQLTEERVNMYSVLRQLQQAVRDSTSVGEEHHEDATLVEPEAAAAAGESGTEASPLQERRDVAKPSPVRMDPKEELRQAARWRNKKAIMARLRAHRRAKQAPQ